MRGADLVILCVPVGACGAVAQAMRRALEAGRDRLRCRLGEGLGDRAGRSRICRRACTSCRPIRSPGTEYSGPDAGFATLFLNRWCILTPPEGTDEAAVERVRAFWAALGSNVEVMTAQHHDLVLAITSHVPHLIAYNIVGTAADLETVTQSEVIKFSAGGFRDFTRIAASDPTMWRDVFLHNKEAVLEMLGRLNEDIALLARAIRWGEGDKLLRPVHPHPRHPARHHLGRPGNAGAGFRPPAREPRSTPRCGSVQGREPDSGHHERPHREPAVVEPQRRQRRRAPACAAGLPPRSLPEQSAQKGAAEPAAHQVAEKPVEAGRRRRRAGRPAGADRRGASALGLDAPRPFGDRQHQDVELAAGLAPALQLLGRRAAREASAWVTVTSS